MTTIDQRQLSQYISNGWHIEEENNLANGQKTVKLSRRELTTSGYAKRGLYALTVAPVSAVLFAGSITSFVLSGLWCYPKAAVNTARTCCSNDVIRNDPEAEAWVRSYNRRHDIAHVPTDLAASILVGGEMSYHELLWNDSDREKIVRTFTVLNETHDS